MAFVISTEGDVSDYDRRQRVFSGVVFCMPPRDSVRALCDFAWDLVREAFGELDPLTAHQHLSVEDYVDILKPLKPGFTHHPRSKELLRDILIDFGADPTETYFDVPKLRAVPPADYLSSGLGYNYKPHRDTWYSAPQCQNNWWAPIIGSTAETGMRFLTGGWQTPVENNSSDFDAYEWNRTSRRDAATYITSDPRPHPHVKDGPVGTDIRLVGAPGSLLSFSGAQLHATVPNTTDTARFSFDFRTVHIDDLATEAGPQNVDSQATGTSVRDYIRADTHERLPDDIVRLYDNDGSADGVLVFDPAVLNDQ